MEIVHLGVSHEGILGSVAEMKVKIQNQDLLDLSLLHELPKGDRDVVEITEPPA